MDYRPDRNALGQPTSVSIPNGMTTAYGYDGRNRLTAIAATYAYTYDLGDDLLTKVEPFRDDFNDGDYAGWSVNGTWSAANHYMTNTSGTSGSFAKSDTDGDFELWFRYLREGSRSSVEPPPSFALGVPPPVHDETGPGVPSSYRPTVWMRCWGTRRD